MDFTFLEVLLIVYFNNVDQGNVNIYWRSRGLVQDQAYHIRANTAGVDAGLLLFCEQSLSNKITLKGDIYHRMYKRVFSEFRGPKIFFKIPPKCHKLVLVLHI